MRDFKQDMQQAGMPQYLIWSFQKFFAEKMGYNDHKVLALRLVCLRKDSECKKCKRVLLASSQAIEAHFKDDRAGVRYPWVYFKLCEFCYSEFLMRVSRELFKIVKLTYRKSIVPFTLEDCIRYDVEI